ncbi:MAG: M16 family metallopeptidase [Gemmatimonadales bacterium]
MIPPDRAAPPAPAPMRHFDFPPVARRRLSNGLDLRVVRMPRLPVASVRLFVRAGESALAHERAGLSVLTADGLDGGTRRRSGTELAAALERIGARFDASGGWEGTSIDLYCVADRLPEALGLLAEALLEPIFPQEEVDRAREQQLAGLRQRLMDPGALASDAALTRYYAADVPYSRPLDGSVGSVEALTRKDLVGYADANLRPGGGGLVVVGDVDVAEVAALAERALGSWSGEPASTDEFTAAPASLARRVLVVDRPGSVQSEIRVGHMGAARLTPDFFALSIANLVLGGMFTSRLNLNLRERNGFTYGVRSSFSLRSQPGPFEVSTSVANESTAPAVREIFAEMTKLADEGPTEDEVSAARDFAAGIFGVQLETSNQIASRVSQLVVFGLADDYFQRYRDDMRAVTLEAAAAAARRHVRPSEAQVVVVGDASQVAGPLEALGLGELEVRPVQREGARPASD